MARPPKAAAGEVETPDVLPDTVALRVLSPIEHDQLRYEIGASLAVPEAVADRLIAGGAARLADAEA